MAGQKIKLNVEETTKALGLLSKAIKKMNADSDELATALAFSEKALNKLKSAKEVGAFIESLAGLFGKTQKNINLLNDSAKFLNTTLENTEKISSGVSSTVRELEDHLDDLEKKYHKNQKALAETNKEIDNLLDQHSLLANQMEHAGDKASDFQSDLNELSDAITSAKKESKKFSEQESELSSKIQESQKALEKKINALESATGSYTKVNQAAKKFSESQTEVKDKTDKAAESTGKLDVSLKDLGGKTLVDSVKQVTKVLDEIKISTTGVTTANIKQINSVGDLTENIDKLKSANERIKKTSKGMLDTEEARAESKRKLLDSLFGVSEGEEENAEKLKKVNKVQEKNIEVTEGHITKIKELGKVTKETAKLIGELSKEQIESAKAEGKATFKSGPDRFNVKNVKAAKEDISQMQKNMLAAGESTEKIKLQAIRMKAAFGEIFPELAEDGIKALGGLEQEAKKVTKSASAEAKKVLPKFTPEVTPEAVESIKKATKDLKELGQAAINDTSTLKELNAELVKTQKKIQNHESGNIKVDKSTLKDFKEQAKQLDKQIDQEEARLNIKAKVTVATKTAAEAGKTASKRAVKNTNELIQAEERLEKQTRKRKIEQADARNQAAESAKLKPYKAPGTKTVGSTTQYKNTLGEEISRAEALWTKAFAKLKEDLADVTGNMKVAEKYAASLSGVLEKKFFADLASKATKNLGQTVQLTSEEFLHFSNKLKLSEEDINKLAPIFSNSGKKLEELKNKFITLGFSVEEAGVKSQEFLDKTLKEEEIRKKEKALKDLNSQVNLSAEEMSNLREKAGLTSVAMEKETKYMKDLKKATTQLKTDLLALGFSEEYAEKKAKELGERLKKKFESDEATKALNRLKQSAGLTSSQISKLQWEIFKSKKSFVSLNKNANLTTRSFVNLSKGTMAVRLGINNLRTAFSAFTVYAVGKSFVKTGIEIDALQRSLSAATGSAKEAMIAQDFLYRSSERLGMIYVQQLDAYKNLAAASKNTVLEGKATRDAFIAVSEAATTMQLKTEDVHNVLYALTQMVSKGTVQTEELRRQMAERLPGAFEIAAHSMGKTTMQFNKMLSTGTVFTADFLPKFSKALREKFAAGLELATQSARANINRLQNRWFDFQQAIMGGGGLVALNEAFKNINTQLKDWKEANDDLIKQKIPEYIASIKGVVIDVWNIIKSIPPEVLTSGFIGGLLFGVKGAAVMYALGNIPGLMDAVTVSMKAFWDLFKKVPEEILAMGIMGYFLVGRVGFVVGSAVVAFTGFAVLFIKWAKRMYDATKLWAEGPIELGDIINSNGQQIDALREKFSDTAVKPTAITNLTTEVRLLENKLKDAESAYEQLSKWSIPNAPPTPMGSKGPSISTMGPDRLNRTKKEWDSLIGIVKEKSDKLRKLTAPQVLADLLKLDNSILSIEASQYKDELDTKIKQIENFNEKQEEQVKKMKEVQDLLEEFGGHEKERDEDWNLVPIDPKLKDGFNALTNSIRQGREESKLLNAELKYLQDNPQTDLLKVYTAAQIRLQNQKKQSLAQDDLLFKEYKIMTKRVYDDLIKDEDENYQKQLEIYTKREKGFQVSASVIERIKANHIEKLRDIDNKYNTYEKEKELLSTLGIASKAYYESEQRMLKEKFVSFLKIAEDTHQVALEYVEAKRVLNEKHYLKNDIKFYNELGVVTERYYQNEKEKLWNNYQLFKGTADDKLKAYRAYVLGMSELNTLEDRKLFSDTGLMTEDLLKAKIEELGAVHDVTISNKKLTNEQLKSLEVKYLTDIKELVDQYNASENNTGIKAFENFGIVTDQYYEYKKKSLWDTFTLIQSSHEDAKVIAAAYAEYIKGILDLELKYRTGYGDAWVSVQQAAYTQLKIMSNEYYKYLKDEAEANYKNNVAIDILEVYAAAIKAKALADIEEKKRKSDLEKVNRKIKAETKGEISTPVIYKKGSPAKVDLNSPEFEEYIELMNEAIGVQEKLSDTMGKMTFPDYKNQAQELVSQRNLIEEHTGGLYTAWSAYYDDLVKLKNERGFGGEDQQVWEERLQILQDKYNTEISLAEGNAEEKLRIEEAYIAARNALMAQMTSDKWESSFDEVTSSIEGMSGALGAFGDKYTDTFNSVSQYAGVFTKIYTDQKSQIEAMGEIQEQINRTNDKDVEKKAKLTGVLKEKEKDFFKSSISGYREVFGTAKKMFKENSKEREAMHKAEKAFAMIEMALNIKKAITSAVASITNAGTSGDAYSAFGRVLAMAALMAGVLSNVGESVSVSGSSSGAGDSDVNKVPESGAGSVFGDPEAISESINASTELLKKYHAKEYKELVGINNAMSDLNKNITGLVESVIRTSMRVFNKTPLDFGLEGGNVLDHTKFINMIDPLSTWVTDKFVGALFGKISYSIKSSGIEIIGKTIGEIISGVDQVGSLFTEIEKKKKSIFGTKRPTDIKYTPLQKEVNDMLTQVFTSMSNTIQQLGPHFGADVNEILAYTFKVNDVDPEILKELTGDALEKALEGIGKINLEGMNADEINEELSAVLSKTSDDAAKALLGDLVEKYVKVGEGAFETAIRIVTEKEVVLAALDKISFGFDSADIPNRAFEFTQALVDMAGGLDEFISLSSEYYDYVTSDADKVKDLKNDLTEDLSKYGAPLPSDKEDLTEWSEGILEQYSELTNSINNLPLPDDVKTPWIDEIAKNIIEVKEITTGSGKDYLDAQKELNDEIESERKKAASESEAAAKKAADAAQKIIDENIKRGETVADLVKTINDALNPMGSIESAFHTWDDTLVKLRETVGLVNGATEEEIELAGKANRFSAGNVLRDLTDSFDQIVTPLTDIEQLNITYWGHLVNLKGALDAGVISQELYDDAILKGSAARNKEIDKINEAEEKTRTGVYESIAQSSGIFTETKWAIYNLNKEFDAYAETLASTEEGQKQLAKVEELRLEATDRLTASQIRNFDAQKTAAKYADDEYGYVHEILARYKNDGLSIDHLKDRGKIEGWFEWYLSASEEEIDALKKTLGDNVIIDIIALANGLSAWDKAVQDSVKGFNEATTSIKDNLDNLYAKMVTPVGQEPDYFSESDMLQTKLEAFIDVNNMDLNNIFDIDALKDVDPELIDEYTDIVSELSDSIISGFETSYDALVDDLESIRDFREDVEKSIKDVKLDKGIAAAKAKGDEAGWLDDQIKLGLSTLTDPKLNIEDQIKLGEELHDLIMERYDLETEKVEDQITLIEDMGDLIISIQDKIRDLRYSSFNLDVPTVKQKDAEDDYGELFALAKGGKSDDVNRYLEFIDTYLQQSQDAFKSSKDYLDIYDQIMGEGGDLDTLNVDLNSLMTVEESLLTDLNAKSDDTISQLQELNREAKTWDTGIALSINSLSKELAGAIAKISVVTNVSNITNNTTTGITSSSSSSGSYNTSNWTPSQVVQDQARIASDAADIAMRDGWAPKFDYYAPETSLADKYAFEKAAGYADGGISTSPQLAMVSEGRYSTEAHIPMPNGRTVPVTMTGSGNDMFETNQLLRALSDKMNVSVYIGNDKLDSRMYRIADKQITERQEYGQPGRGIY